MLLHLPNQGQEHLDRLLASQSASDLLHIQFPANLLNPFALTEQVPSILVQTVAHHTPSVQLHPPSFQIGTHCQTVVRQSPQKNA